MRITLDTNIIIDILERREPFFTDSYLVLRNALENGDLCMMPVSSMTDVAYILRKTHDVKTKLISISEMLELTDATESDFENAIRLDINDFEDAFLSANAKRNKADYIITRNAPDFANSPVKAMTPREFLDTI